jgi:aminopeptidase N
MILRHAPLLTFLIFCSSASAQHTADPLATDPLASGGPLVAEQAAYRVHFYDLALEVRPSERTIAGRNVMHAIVMHPTSVLAVDLDTTFTISRISDARFGDLTFDRRGGRVWVDFGRTLQPGDDITMTIAYAGRPRIAPRPPWVGGFIWVDREDGTHWVGVANQGEGADLWWPVKDHPSDRADSLRIALTVPGGHEAIANGRLRSVTEEDGRRTFDWFVSTPINNYSVSLYVGPFVTLEADYLSVTGEPMPFSLHVLPEAVEDAARQLPQFVDQMRFLEETFGPYPFRADKYAVVHAPYLGMEHQTAIAYGDDWQDNAFGFDWLHLHELAHEWFANLVTVPDWSHLWVHEGFAMYIEALYAERIRGIRHYHGYMRQRMRGVIANRQPVVPQPNLDTQEVYFGRPDQTDQDVYFKGAWFLHTLRWKFRAELGEDAGDRTFMSAMRRVAYPDPALETDRACAACRFATTRDVMRIFSEALGADLEDEFRLYLHQPALPRLATRRTGDGLALRWETPPGYPLALPIEVDVDGRRQVVEMTGGAGFVSAPARARITVDPDSWVLREEDERAAR